MKTVRDELTSEVESHDVQYDDVTYGAGNCYHLRATHWPVTGGNVITMCWYCGVTETLEKVEDGDEVYGHCTNCGRTFDRVNWEDE